MAIGIQNMGASIRFTSGESLKLVLKHTIKTISVIRHETIRIDVSEAHKAIAFRHAEVTEPVTSSAQALAYLINDMVTECVCCNCTGPDNSHD
jgi:hypothetical protein